MANKKRVVKKRVIKKRIVKRVVKRVAKRVVKRRRVIKTRNTLSSRIIGRLKRTAENIRHSSAGQPFMPGGVRFGQILGHRKDYRDADKLRQILKRREGGRVEVSKNLSGGFDVMQEDISKMGLHTPRVNNHRNNSGRTQ